MRKLLLLVLIALCCNVYAQKHDAEGQTKLVVVNQNDKEIHCRVLIDKVKQLQLDLKTEYYWCQNQQIRKNRGGYSGDLLHGVCKSFDSKKRLIEEGLYVYGRKEGIWKLWDKDGELIRTTSWKNGLRNGLNYRYFYDGQFVRENYKDNSLHGRRTEQTRDSVHYEFYRNGKLIKHKSVALDKGLTVKKKKSKKEKKKLETRKVKKDKRKNRSEQKANQQEM